MDRRVEKTRSSIINAFLELRAHKDIEQIKVKELCEKAQINKSTFYTHFQDIYDLSDQLETQIAADILNQIGSVEEIFTQPDAFTRKFYYAFLAQTHLVHILFSGSRSDKLVERIESTLMEAIYKVYPDLCGNAVVHILLTLEIYGEYYSFMKCRHMGDDVVIETLCRHWSKSVEYLREADPSFPI